MPDKMKSDDPEFWTYILNTPIKTDPEFWLREHKYTFLFNTLNLMALHGFLCLALRHPGTEDHACRPAIEGIVKEIGIVLVDLGALTPDALREIQRVEFEEGSKDFEEIIKTGMQ